MSLKITPGGGDPKGLVVECKDHLDNQVIGWFKKLQVQYTNWIQTK